MSFIVQYNVIPFALIGSVLYLLARLIFVKKRKIKFKPGREFLMLVFVAYLISLASLTVLPQISLGIDSLSGQFFFNVNIVDSGNINLVPFRTISELLTTNNHAIITHSDWQYLRFVYLLGNLFLLAPFGFLLPILWKNYNFKHTILFAMAIVITIEFTQYFIGRNSDIDDLILNTLGAMSGYGLYKVYCWLSKRMGKNADI